MANMFRRMAPAVFVGTAAVLVVSNASSGAPVAADATATTTSPGDTAAAPQPSGDAFGFFGDDDDDDHGSRNDDGDGDRPAPRTQSQPVPAPGSGTSRNGGSGSSGSTSGGTTTQGSGNCSASEVTGPVVRTEWGPVQVAAKVEGGKVCAVRTLQHPTGDRQSMMINARALPALEQQVLAAGDASFDGVSGATVTSEGYRKSLQAILDQAR